MPLTTGFQMKLSSIIKALVSVYLLLADGFPVSEEEFPVIIGPNRAKIQAHTGEQLVLHCDALTNYDDDETLIYWLINGSFPEDTLNHGRIVELNQLSSEEGSILQRSLLLKNVTSEDFKSIFSCVVTNAMKMDQKYTTLATTTGE